MLNVNCEIKINEVFLQQVASYRCTWIIWLTEDGRSGIEKKKRTAMAKKAFCKPNELITAAGRHADADVFFAVNFFADL